MIGVFDGQHHVQQKIDHMGMAPPDVIPGIPAKFGGTPIIKASDKKYHTR